VIIASRGVYITDGSPSRPRSNGLPSVFDRQDSLRVAVRKIGAFLVGPRHIGVGITQYDDVAALA